MGLPGHRRTSSDKRRRASHFALKKMNISVCPKCKEPIQPHHACLKCGFYAGREVINMGRASKRTVKKTLATPSKKADAHADHDHAKDEKKPEAKAS